MVRARRFEESDLEQLKKMFSCTIELGAAIYGDLLFHPWSAKENDWSSRPQIAFADAVMVGLSRYLDHGDRLAQRATHIVEATRQLFQRHEESTFTGRGNTKQDVNERIDFFAQMLAHFAAP
jgi:hypothetical protein